MKTWTSTLYHSLVAVLVAATALGSAGAQIRMRGITTDLSNSADRFLSLDLNGDGKSDLLYYRPGGGYASAYLSHGDGTFRQVDYVSGGTGYNGFPGDLSNPKDTFVAGDFNGDGKSDFIEYRPGSGYTILCLSVGDGSVNCENLSTPSGTAYGFKDSMTQGNEHIVTLDLNGDGKSDFIDYAPGGGFAHAYLSNGNGTFTELVLANSSTGNNQVGFADGIGPSTVIVPLDVNHDGYADLLVSTPQSSDLRLYLNNGSTTSPAFTRFDLGVGGSNNDGFTGNAGDPNAHLLALDLNGDGKSDFLWWQAGSGVVTGYLSNGSGGFTAVPYDSGNGVANGFTTASGSTADTAIALDLNNGAYTGFLWYTPGQGNVVVYSSSASGALRAEKLTSNGAEANGFQDTDQSTNSIALAANFRGYSDSGGFLWYVPGSGTILQAYEGVNGPGFPLNNYSFTTYPATYLSDLNWSIGNVPLKEVVMLGTHDTAMYGLTSSADPSETQWGDVSDQIAYGARVLDFRSGYYLYLGSNINQLADIYFEDIDGNSQFQDPLEYVPANGFYMFGHSNILTDRSPLALLNQVEGWLMQNPNEIALIDMNNTSGGNNGGFVSNSGGNFGPLFEQLLQQTNYPSLLYTPTVACGKTTCPSSYNPQNRSINALKALGTRLILMDVPGSISAFGWQNNLGSSGYCGNSGISAARTEIDCINNGSTVDPSSGGAALTSLRPNYTAADADSRFYGLKAVLTYLGGVEPGDLPGLGPPLTLSDNSSYGFNTGTSSYDLPAELANGAWSINALNLVYLDGIEGDNVENQFIQRNNQTWLNAAFFNNNAPQPAGAISVSSTGVVWAAGSGHSTSIFQYNPNSGTWTDKINSEPNVKKLAADAQGGVWVIEQSSTGSGPLVYYNASGNKSASTSVVQDVAVGSDGSVWAIGENGALFNIDSGPNVKPSSIPAQSGVHLAIDNRGYPWVVQSNGNIERYNGSSWVQVTGVTANEIAIGADGSVLITGHDTPSVGRLNNQGNNFNFFLMDATHIAVDGTGHPWAIRQGTGAVYKGALDQM